MTWNVIVARDAQKNLKKFLARDRDRIAAALVEMRDEPFRGDVAPLRNYPMEFRKRVEDYRIFFDLDRQWMLVLVHDVGAGRRKPTAAAERRTSGSVARRPPVRLPTEAGEVTS